MAYDPDEIVTVQIITDAADVREFVVAQVLNGIDARCDGCSRAVEIAAALVLTDGSEIPLLVCESCLDVFLEDT